MHASTSRARRGFSLVELVIVIAIIGILAAIAVGNVGGCGRPDASKAIEVVEALGMTDARVTDTDTWNVARSGCSDSDGIAFKVTAKNVQEKPVNLTVCCGTGWNAKGCTPRF